MNMPRLAQQITSAYLGQLSSVANIWLGRLGDDPRALKELWRELPLPRTLDQENACSELSKALHSSSPVLETAPPTQKANQGCPQDTPPTSAGAP